MITTKQNIYYFSECLIKIKNYAKNYNYYRKKLEVERHKLQLRKLLNV